MPASIVTTEPEALEILRHSTAHLLAQAVKSIYPDAQVTIGPVIEDGFYYDFAYQRAVHARGSGERSKRRWRAGQGGPAGQRRVIAREAAMAFFLRSASSTRREIIESIPERRGRILYRQGDWHDLCRGPHVPSTGKLKAFKLMKVAGAYWRGDAKNAMLQRIYGTAWPERRSSRPI